MATLQKAIKVGSSIAAVLPKALLKETGITAGTSITVERMEDGVFIRPTRKVKGRVESDEERVAQSALGLINRYKNALERLANA